MRGGFTSLTLTRFPLSFSLLFAACSVVSDLGRIFSGIPPFNSRHPCQAILPKTNPEKAFFFSFLRVPSIAFPPAYISLPSTCPCTLAQSRDAVLGQTAMVRKLW